MNIHTVLPSPMSGGGYIGGDDPDGLVTISGAPTAQRLLLMHDGSRMIVAQTMSSAVDGTYRFNSLNPSERFSVILKMPVGSTYQDQIKGRIFPRPY